MFRTFDLNPNLMRDTLYQTQSVYFGSYVILIVLPWVFTTNDMDLDVPAIHAAHLLHLLSTHFGYALNEGATECPGTVDVFALYKLPSGRHR